MKKYNVIIALGKIGLTVCANDAKEAKQKALDRLDKKKPSKMIANRYSGKKEIYIDEVIHE